ncbi:MAG: hypothetical protein LBH98_08780 [Chitinispirillales bacterium]|jgi:hypothetical protein|nr:hypothetical protein [Chitinispirillales bacterium]
MVTNVSTELLNNILNDIKDLDFKYNYEYQHEVTDYYTKTFEEIEKKPYGMCYDLTNYLHFKLMDYNPKSYFIFHNFKDSYEIGCTHTFTVIDDSIMLDTALEGDYITIADSLEEIFDFQDSLEANEDMYRLDFVVIYEYTPDNVSRGIFEFIEWIEDTGTVIDYKRKW